MVVAAPETTAGRTGGEGRPATAPTSIKDSPSRLAPFNPSSQQIQNKTLEMLRLTSDDILFDLGCGDGRLLFYAAQQTPGLRCVGIEMDTIYAERGKHSLRLQSEDIRSRVEIRIGDVLEELDEAETAGSRNASDEIDAAATSVQGLSLLDDATAVYLFILPKGLVMMMPLLNALIERRKRQNRPIRVLSYMFKIREWVPTAIDSTSKGNMPVYMYRFDPVHKHNDDECP